MSAEFKKEVLKHVPVMHQYNLHEAADYMRDWVNGALTPMPLLDVSVFHGQDLLLLLVGGTPPDKAYFFYSCCKAYLRPLDM